MEISASCFPDQYRHYNDADPLRFCESYSIISQILVLNRIVEVVFCCLELAFECNLFLLIRGHLRDCSMF